MGFNINYNLTNLFGIDSGSFVNYESKIEMKLLNHYDIDEDYVIVNSKLKSISGIESNILIDNSYTIFDNLLYINKDKENLFINLKNNNCFEITKSGLILYDVVDYEYISYLINELGNKKIIYSNQDLSKLEAKLYKNRLEE